MLVHPWDAARGAREWRAFVQAQGFGQLVAAGRGRDVPVVVPTQFLAAPAGDEVLLHLARPNPIWSALADNPLVVLSVAGDWAYVPGAWKAIGAEDPAYGIPTTLYAAVQLTAVATVVDDPAGKLDILRAQLAGLEPDGGLVDPAEHAGRLPGIRGLRLAVTDVLAKFKYGGNLDAEHREALADRLAARGAPGDAAASTHLLRRARAGGGPG